MQRIVGTANSKSRRDIIETTSYCPTCRSYLSKYMEHDDEIMQGDLRINDPDGWAALAKSLA
jgi:hypothetical protein